MLLTSCTQKNKIANEDPLNDFQNNNEILKVSFTDEELQFMNNNNLSIEDILPYKKYNNFNINNYFLYEKLI